MIIFNLKIDETMMFFFWLYYEIEMNQNNRRKLKDLSQNPKYITTKILLKKPISPQILN